MTATLLLLLKGPMQAWGDSSRYKIRATGQVPTKSGVIGMLAAAQGRRRSDPVTELAGLRFAVRVDQPGSLLRDYQTAQEWQTGGGTRLVTRYYLADAVFVAAIEADDREFLENLAEALRKPRFPLFLGRRNCPVPPGLVIGVRAADAVAALRDTAWQASRAHRCERTRSVSLPIYRDAGPGEEGVPRQDVPVSFVQEHRRYSWREVVQDEPVTVDNPEGRSDDPFFEAVISA